MNLRAINAWTDDEAIARRSGAAADRAAGPSRWHRRRPFDSEAALLEAAERIWWGLAEADWLEAFAAHPRIGDLDALRAKFAATAAWASREQAGVDRAPGGRARGSRRWETAGMKSGSATSSSSAPPARRPRRCSRCSGQRLPNDPDAEIKLAAAEQAKITTIRLEKIAP